MQKKIIALAVAGLSTAAFAQTNVTVYGVADVSAQGTNMSSSKAQPNTATGGAFGLKSNSSLLGFKGTEALGNGLNAMFQMETSVNLAGQGGSASSTTANSYAPGLSAGSTSAGGWGQMRDSFVGLNSKYGTVLGGFLSTPYRSTLNSFDVMPGATGDGRIENVMGTARVSAQSNTAGALAFASSVRATAIAYALPTMYGFNGSIATTGNGNNTGTNSYETVAGATGPQLRSGMSFNLGWTGYGVNVAGAFSQFGYSQAASAANTVVSGYTSYLVGASYTGLPGLKASVVYNRNTLGTNAMGANTAQKGSNNQIYVGASYRFGNNEPRLAYANTSNISGMNEPGNGVYASQTGANQWTANWGYYLSKRTQVYGIVSRINNNANGNYNMGSAGTNLTPSGGQAITTYGAGLRTNF